MLRPGADLGPLPRSTCPARIVRSKLEASRPPGNLAAARTHQTNLSMLVFTASTRRLLSAFTGVTMLWSASARAEPRAEADPETFAYTSPTEKNYLRAFLELEALTTVSVVWYVIAVRQGGDVGYSWQMFERKLAGKAIAFDDNAFGTNFHGHGVGGNAYYLSARSNHLSIGESFGYAVAGATLWEYFGEISEVISVNDLIVTPFSGITVGEPFMQLGAFFDRQSPTLLHRVLGSTFAPIKSVNDALDGVTLSRQSGPDDEWHRFSFSSAATVTHSEVSAQKHSEQYRDGLRFEISERLARLRNYDGETNRSGWFDDANLSGLSFGLAFSHRGLQDLAFSANVVPVGYFERSARRQPGGELYGGGFVVGFEMGYRYLLHDYGGTPQSSLDRAAFIQPLGLMFEHRAALGAVSLTSKLDAAAAFGGIHPIALDAYGDRSNLASVLQHKGYYFGAGGQLEAALTLRWLRLELGASLLARHFVRVDPHVTQSIEDNWQRFDLGAGMHIHPAWMLRAFSEDALRTGRLGDARTTAHERVGGFEVRSIF